MGCCIAVAMIIALVRKAWFALVPGGPPADVLFAPGARRASDGSVIAPPRRELPAAPAAPASRTALGLGAAAVAVAFYAGVVAVLRATGVAQSAAGAPVTWLTRDLVVGSIGAVLIVTAAVLFRGGRPRGHRGPVLFGAGSAYFGLGVLDMHVFGLLHLSSHGPLADALFHGPGLLAMVLGIGAYAGELRRQTSAELAAVAR